MSATQALSIRDTAMNVYRFLWESRRDLFAMITVPVLALSLVSALAGIFAPQPGTSAERVDPSFLPVLLVVLIVSTVFYVMFAVAWHRRSLMPQEQTTILTALRWDGRKSRFLLRFLAINIVLIAVALPIAIIGSIVGGTITMVSAVGGLDQKAAPTLLVVIGIAVLAGLFLLVNGRLSLWLPAAAVDEPLTMLEAWNLGQGNSWRLAGVILLSCAPGFVVLLVAESLVQGVGQIAGIGASLTFRLFAALILNLANYIVIASIVSAVSFCYRQLRPPITPGMPFQM